MLFGLLTTLLVILPEVYGIRNIPICIMGSDELLSMDIRSRCVIIKLTGAIDESTALVEEDIID